MPPVRAAEAIMTPAAGGLSSSEARRRLAQTGLNELRREQAGGRIEVSTTPVLQAYLHRHWAVLRHAQIREPAFAVLALIEKWRVGATVARDAPRAGR